VRANLVYPQFTRMGPKRSRKPRLGTSGTCARTGSHGEDSCRDGGSGPGTPCRDRSAHAPPYDRRRRQHSYPTDSSLLGDGVRVVTRWMKKVTAIAGTVGTKLRDRSRSMQRRLMEIGRASRGKGPQAQEKVQTRVRQTAGSHPPGGGQAKKFSTEIGQGIKQAR